MNNPQFSFFYQLTPEGPWKVAPASQREEIITRHKPPFTTVLDVNSNFGHDLTKEEQDELK